MSKIKNWPKQKLPFKSKGPKWRKSHLDFADEHSYINSGIVRKRLKTKRINLNLYNGKIDMTDLKLIINPGEVKQHFLPSEIQHYPILTPRVNVLVGEEKRRKFDWTVKIVNPNTLSKIKDEKMELVRAKVQEWLGSDLSDEEMNKEMESYSDYINFDYQDIREKRANLLMKHYIAKLDMKVKFQQGFKDSLIMGEEIYMFDIVNGSVTFEKLNPLNVHTLRSGYSNKIEDSDIIVIDEFWSPGKIQDHYYADLKAKEVDKLDGKDRGGTNVDSDGENVAHDDVGYWNMVNSDSNRDSINGMLEASGIYQNNNHGGSKMYEDTHGNVRVLRMFWKSLKLIKKITFFDEQGKQQTKFRNENYIVDAAKGETEEEYWVTQWWKGTKIGKDTYVKIQPREIQYNKIGEPNFNSCGIVGQVYNTNEEEAVSLVDKAKSFQYLYDISWYRVNEALNKYLGSIVELDLAKIPSGWSVTKWLYFARKSGISIVDSFKEGESGQSKGKLAGAIGNTTGKVLEQRVGDYIQVHMEMMDFAKAQMDEVTGVSRQRLGQVENRETVGGVERAVSQSNHITEELFTLHDWCKKRCFEILLETAKIAMKGNKMKFAYIADDFTNQLIEIDGEEFSNEDYGLQVSNDDEINQMQQKLDSMIQLGLQNSMISFSSAMKMYSSSSMREVQRLIEKDEKNMQESQAKAAEDQNKALQDQAQKLEAKEFAERAQEQKNFDTEDNTKRYIAELKAETDRINKANENKGIEAPTEEKNDDLEYEKFRKDYEHKNLLANNDMSKHNDLLSIKEKELVIKKKAANKPATVSK
jgi:hypothetical protein